MLAATTLVASLLAVTAGPADAATDTADHTTKLSACVGGALGDQMFTDVSDEHAFKNAINCVAYYGITNGTGDGSTYSPNADVTRAEMAFQKPGRHRRMRLKDLLDYRRTAELVETYADLRLGFGCTREPAPGTLVASSAGAAPASLLVT